MTIFDNKTDFFARGVEHIVSNAYHMSQNCVICLDSLALVKKSSPGSPHLHDAVRIKSCRHIHGEECLDAWLEVGNTCPTCKKVLVLPVMEQPLTQQDVDEMTRELRDRYDEDAIGYGLARYMHKSEAAAKQRKQQVETMVVMEAAKQKEKEEKDRKELLLNDDDFLASDDEFNENDFFGSDEELNLGEENDDDHEEEEEE